MPTRNRGIILRKRKKLIKDNIFFWKTVKPLFYFNYGGRSQQIPLIEKYKVISKDGEVAENPWI